MRLNYLSHKSLEEKVEIELMVALCEFAKDRMCVMCVGCARDTHKEVKFEAKTFIKKVKVTASEQKKSIGICARVHMFA